MNVTAMDWEPTPSFKELFWSLKDFVYLVWEPERSAMTTKSYLSVLKENGVGLRGFSSVVAFAILLTIARSIVSKVLIQPFCQHYQVSLKSHSKMAESCWKLLFYSIASVWGFYIVVIKYGFLQRPSTTFSNVKESAVPGEIEMLYFAQFSFYVHSIYTLFVMDEWRKDSPLLVYHHLLTLFLVGMSYLGRFTEIGTLVCLFHDSCDVWLEYAKINNYLKIQDGKYVPLYDTLSAICFTLFCSTWFISRVYWFPLKAIHVLATSIVTGIATELPFIYMAYVMLWVLYAMDVYWSVLISLMLLQVIKGTTFKDLEDIREDAKEKKS